MGIYIKIVEGACFIVGTQSPVLVTEEAILRITGKDDRGNRLRRRKVITKLSSTVLVRIIRSPYQR